MSVAILGAGAIAGYVQEALARQGHPVSAYLVRPARLGLPGRVARVCDLPVGTSLLVDCAGHDGLRAHGGEALAAGLDVLTLSIGALAEEDLARHLAEAAAAGGARLWLASGAIGGLDALRAARAGGLEAVTYRGIKPPLGWRGSAAEDVMDLDAPGPDPVTHFSGSAREAALRYPRNANVAAAVALSGLGLDATRVALVADPSAQGNRHEITARGAFGEMRFEITGAPLPGNPRSSALAAMSLVAALDDPEKRICWSGQG